MARAIKVEVKKLETQAIGTRVNAEILKQFQMKCKQQTIPMNVLIEAFARQYTKGEYELFEENIIKWDGCTSIEEGAPLSTPINKEVYYKFKDVVKQQGYFVGHVLSAFIEDYVKNDVGIHLVKKQQ